MAASLRILAPERLVPALLDFLIASAYLAISFTLFYIARRRTSGMRSFTLLFSALLFSQGVSHLFAGAGTPRLFAASQAILASMAVLAAILCIRFAPLMIRVPTTRDLQQINETLAGEIETQKRNEQKLGDILRAERATETRSSEELARAHAELSEREALLRSLLEAASQAIVIIDPAGLIVMVNRTTEVLFGYTREELLGQPLELLVPVRFRDSHARRREGYFAEPRMRPMGVGMQLAGLRKDGTEFPVEVGLSGIETSRGMLVMAMISDITERQEAAGRLARMNEDLRRSNDELEQFAHVASHDLQEPLRMITGYLNILERRYATQLGGDAREFIAYAVDGANRMKSMIREILALSRIGTQAVTRLHVPSDEIVRAALDNLSAAIEESHAEISLDPLPQIFADPGVLVLTFQNLIANAIKFRGDEPPRIRISASRDPHEWIFSIADNGIGIPEDQQNRIFRMFERLHNAENYPGTGVGLAMAKKTVERHGGRIWVASSPGHGSVFSFSIPA